MPDFKNRSYQKELLDGSNLSFRDIQLNMRELDLINKKLGGHAVTLKGLENLIKRQTNHSHKIFIVEIGCGGGDNLRAIKSWAGKKNITVQLLGVDINAACVEFAKAEASNKGIDFMCSDYRHASLNFKPDIIFSSLFCHHFTNEELISQWQWMEQNAREGFFINDLHRHRIAYYSIKFLTRLFSKSYLVKNDAPLSVQRGFTKNELEKLLRLAGIWDYKIQWRWAFRWLVISFTCKP